MSHDSADHDSADHELRVLLRVTDPARALPLLTDTERARALEDAMDDHREGPRTPDGYATREGGTRHRNPLTWVVAAAAALVIGGVAWAGLHLADGEPAGPTATAPGSTAPTADPSPTTDEPGPGPSSSPSHSPGADGAPQGGPAVRLALPDASGATARCMVPSAQVLNDQEVAFEGTVAEVTEETVTFEVGEWFRGGDSATAEVEAVEEALQQVIVAPDFVEGRRYLVSASGGLVTLCGFSEEADPQLRVLYDRAFG